MKSNIIMKEKEMFDLKSKIEIENQKKLEEIQRQESQKRLQEIQKKEDENKKIRGINQKGTRKNKTNRRKNGIGIPKTSGTKSEKNRRINQTKEKEFKNRIEELKRNQEKEQNMKLEELKKRK